VITSVLSDGTIRRLVAEGRLKVQPWDPAMVQPASIDLNLGSSFRVFHNHRLPAIDLAAPPKDVTELVQTAEGQSFVIHPGEFVLGATAEWVELPQDLVARIEGKALALDTPVPTPSGWRTMAELQVGDEVFDAGGRPTVVVDATEPLVGRPCRELVFADETTIVADLTHRWVVATRTDRGRRLGGRVLTTEQIERCVRQRGEHNQRFPLARAVDYPEPVLRQLEHAGYRRAPGPIASGQGRSDIPDTLARLKHSGTFHSSRAIADVRPVDSVPVRCIQVASLDGVYLVSRSFIPTHNSSLGRLGLIVHATAGFVDPGFKGTLTLEITNLTRVPIVLWPGKPIAQLSFMALDRPAERPYGHPDLGSHYHGQSEATESRYEGGRGHSR
jgi:deoxycytidine triphosphate deaminase